MIFIKRQNHYSFLFFSQCFLLLFLLVQVTVVSAQRQPDLEAWTGFELRKNLPKGFAASLEWQSRFDDNISQLKRNYFYVGSSYKLKKWVYVLLQYRFSTNQFSDVHRFRTGLNFKAKYKKISFANRLVYQQQYGFLSDEWIQEFGHTRVLRNRLRASYGITKKIGISLSAEPSWLLEMGAVSLRRIRYMAALDFNLPKRFTLNTFYVIQPEYNRVNPSINYMVGVFLGYDLPGKKKKNKDKGAKPVAPEQPKEKPPHNE